MSTGEWDFASVWETVADTVPGLDRSGLADQARFLKRQLSLPVSTMSQ